MALIILLDEKPVLIWKQKIQKVKRTSDLKEKFEMINYINDTIINHSLTTVKLIIWQIAEILKDRPSWFRDCRSLEVFTMFPAGNGGTIELVYMQVRN